MRIYNPFNIFPNRVDPHGSHLWAKMTFIDIDATAKLLRGNGSVVMEMPFRFDPAARRFIAVNQMNLPIIFKWNDVSRIEVLIPIYYEMVIPGKVIVKETQKWLNVWYVNYGEKGTTLSAETYNPKRLDKRGDKVGATFQVSFDVVTPTVQADLGSAKIILHLDTSINIEGLGINVGPVSGNTGSEEKSYSMDFEFTLAYLVTNRPQEVIQLPEHLLSHDVLFEDEGQSEISNVRYDKLAELWVTPLRKEVPRLAAAIETGMCPIKLIGHATVTGRSKEYNLALSGKRIASVADAIKKLFKTNKLVYVSIPLGVMAATRPGRADQERRVEIVIERGAARSILSKE